MYLIKLYKVEETIFVFAKINVLRHSNNTINLKKKTRLLHGIKLVIQIKINPYKNDMFLCTHLNLVHI